MSHTKLLHSLTRFKRDKRGVTAVEFSLVGAPFFMLLFSIIEASLHFFAGQVLERAVLDTARMAQTGQLGKFATTKAFRDELAHRTSFMFDRDKFKIYVSIAQDFKSLDEPIRPDKNGNYPEEKVAQLSFDTQKVEMINVLYEWPIVTNYVQAYWSNLPNGNSLLAADAIFKTEPI